MPAPSSHLPRTAASLSIALAQLNSVVGDFQKNSRKLLDWAAKLQGKVDFLISPEMHLTSYPLDDLVNHPEFMRQNIAALQTLCEAWHRKNFPDLLIGAPRYQWGRQALKDKTFNSLYHVSASGFSAACDKYYLPNHDVFDEVRLFSRGDSPGVILQHADYKIGLLICQDAWYWEAIARLKAQHADFLLIVNGSPFALGKHQQRLDLFSDFAKRAELPILYLNRIGGQDSLVFDGASFALDAKGRTVLQMPSFEESVGLVHIRKNLSELTFECELFAESPVEEPGKAPLTRMVANKDDSRLSDIYHAMALGLHDYVVKNGFRQLILGLSGGIDSALTATIAADIFGGEALTCLLMPSLFTQQSSIDDAAVCAKNLDSRHHIIPIGNIFDAVLQSLAPFLGLLRDGVTHENLQARIRGVLLMAFSNYSGAMLLSTSNKSESACGYATLYGDMCGGYAPLIDVYKSDIFALSHWRNRTIPNLEHAQKTQIIPQNIITKAPNAELRENQQDSDSLPPYDILDGLLFHMVEQETDFPTLFEKSSPETVNQIWTMMLGSEYKRFQAPPGAKISTRAFGRERRYPLTAHFAKKPLREKP